MGTGNIKGIADGDAVEPRSRDSQHFKGISVQRQALANHGRIARKISLPEGIADVCTGSGAAGLVILGPKKTAQKQPNAEHVKEIAADPDALCEAHFSARWPD